MNQMIAYCGLVCTGCPAYTATQANDAAAIEQIAREWAEAYGVPVTAEDVWCDGCLSDGPRLCAHCGECEVRACATGRGVVNCGHCDDYGCDIIAGFLANAPQAKTVLEEIRAGL
jgi:hypothetical protein